MIQQNSESSDTQRLSDAKRALLEKRLRGELKTGGASEAIPVHDKTGSIPLSFAQERLWFLNRLEPQSPAYNMYNVVRLHGNLNKELLKKSFNLLVGRHHVLRSVLVVEGDRPYQKIRSDSSLEIPEIHLPHSDQERLQEVITAEIRRPFDLSTGPLLRAILIQRSDDDHILVLTLHHIIFDEWSNEVFWRELSAIYQALLVGAVPKLPDLPVQYADFTLWQRRQIDKHMANQLAYWKKQLTGDLPVIELPTDRPRPSQQTFRGAMKWIAVPNSLYGRLRSLNQELGTTMFMSLLAAFQLLLTRYTGQSDIRVGTPIANRTRPETKGLIGLFLNTLVLRADLELDPSFVNFAAQVRRSSLDAFAHQDLPFEILVDELRPHRDMSHNPIFQVMFVHQRSAIEEIHLPGLQASQVPVEIGVSKFDLTLFAQESEEGLNIGLEYNTDLFDPSTAERLLVHYQTLLESIVLDPHSPISKLQLITAAERATLLQEWNDTDTEPIPDVCIHQLIEVQAAKKPSAVAVADPAGHLTYAELDRRANQLAGYLRRQGVGPDVPVGLLLERSTDMMVAILGVLKAGGAYLPLDPAYPKERLAYMLDDAQAPVVVTQEKLHTSIAYKAKTFCIDADWAIIAGESTACINVPVVPENLAYIIYTSGSTGRPRGVPVSHRNLVYSTLARDHFYENRVESFLLLSSFTFDSSVAGIFWTLCQGGKLVLPPQRIEQDMHQLAQIIAEQKISHTLCLPSLHMLLLELADVEQLSSLRTVIVAGEECQQDLIRRHYSTLSKADLYNEYGPTEGTVWSTAYKIPAGFSGNHVPIGRPIPNVQNYILDRHGQPAPIGVPGELCIGGPGVTKGYLNAPEQTAQKYVELSLAGGAARRLYRTGDRARYVPDGHIEFLGRIDQQIKIRGNRVELGEIESYLRRVPNVRDVVVVARNGRLVCYVIPESRDASLPDWHSYLSDYLPVYMIPSNMVTLVDFPRTPNGKLDRNALPNPESADPDTEFVGPRSNVEQVLADIWTRVLSLERVGVHDDFFELGGNSLLSIRIFARIAEQFKVDLPLSVLFTDTTISKLAARISEQSNRAESWPVLVPIQPRGSKQPFFCVHGIGGGVVGYKFLSDQLGDEQPFFGLQAVGQDGRDAYDASIESMAARYIAAMRTHQPRGPYRIGGYCFGGVVAYEMACQLEKMGEQISLLAILEGGLPDVMDTRVHLWERIRAIIKSIPVWVRDYSSMSRGELVQRLQLTIAKVTMKFRRDPELDRRMRVEETLAIESDKIPKRNVELTTIQMNAALHYRPSKYNGVLTLFRAHNRSVNEVVLGSLDPTMGWSRLASQVKVLPVDGYHRNMHLAPYAESLAVELKKCLDS